MSLISTTFAAELNDREMRGAYLSAQTRTHLSYQIRTIRSQRGWSQEEFAKKLNTSQSAVSRMEDREYGKQNLQTLIEVANAFDCGLVVQFVRYDDFIRQTDDLSREALEVSEFNETMLLPLSEDQIPSINVGNTLPLLWQQANEVIFDPNVTFSAYVGAQNVGALQYNLAPFSALISDQSLQTSPMVCAAYDEIDRLKAEVAELKAQLEMRDRAPIMLWGANRQPSQLPRSQ